ncbi:MAG: carboxypeptidase-like regulatory domain-containing protein, partial [Planctomycetota bacterium]|nr:carboxypeptidase-like regulatory domain-containing protein [Planctomycetota bacterium]
GAAIGIFSPRAKGGPVAPRFAATDANGEAQVGELPAGQLVVIARGSNGWSRRRFIQVHSDQHASIVLKLEPMAGLVGRVVDSNGLPMRDRAVFAQTTAMRPWSFDNTLHAQLAHTDADGYYSLQSLSAEPTRVRLVTNTKNAELSQRTITLLPGEQGNLDFRVEVQQLSGQLLDIAQGAGSGWTVEAVALGADGSLLNTQRFSGKADPQGRFRIEVSDRFQDFRLFAAPAHCTDPRFLYRARTDARPAQSPLTLSSKHTEGPGATGRILLPPGTTADSVQTKLMRGSLSRRLALAADGSFSTGRLPADRYRLVTRSTTAGTLVLPLQVQAHPAAAAPLDLGEIVWPSPGSLTVLPLDPRGRPVAARIWLTDNEGHRITDLRASAPNAVAPGDYWLCAAGEQLPPARQRVTVVSGQSLVRELLADVGVTCVLEFPFASIENVLDLDVALHLKLMDDQDNVLLTSEIPLTESERFRWQQKLKAGNYRVVCATEWGGRAETALTITAKQTVLTRTVPLSTARD